MAKNPDTFEELMKKVLEILPDAEVTEFQDQLVVWTGLREVSGGILEPVPEEEFFLMQDTD